jgi:hypothetical protein
MTARRGFRLDRDSGDSGGSDSVGSDRLMGMCVSVSVVVIVAIVAEAVAVVTSIDIAVRLGRERRVRERRNLFEASKLHGISAIG